MRTCWLKHKHKHKLKTISQSASTNAYVNNVLTEHKHKKMLMVMSWLSSLAHELLMLMFMLMLASLVGTGP